MSSNTAEVEPFFADPEPIRPAHFQDQWIRNGRYRLPHPDFPDKELNAERASNFAKTISNTLTLNQWHVRKTVEGMAMHQSLVLEAVGYLSDGLEPGDLRNKIQDIASAAQAAAGSKEPSSRGTFLHGLTVKEDLGRCPALPDPWERDMIAYRAILQKTGIQCVPEYTEKSIWNREMNIAGTFDRMVRYLRHTDKWVVLDLKTGRAKDLQYSWAEIPIQLWCYAMGDVICDPQKFDGWSLMPDTCTDLGLVLHLPQGEGTATLFEVDLGTTVEVPPQARPADLVIAVQKWRRTRRLVRVIARIEVTEHGEVRDVPLTWGEQMDWATSEAELEDIAADAVAAGAWKASVTKRKNDRLNTLLS